MAGTIPQADVGKGIGNWGNRKAKMNWRSGFLPCASLLVAGGMVGCGFGNSFNASLPSQPAKPTGVLFVQAPPSSMAVKASVNIYAAAIYAFASNAGNAQVNYSMSCASAGACGTFSGSEEVGAVTYTAPPAIPVGGKVTITATSLADPTKSISATITIVPPIPISVSFYVSPPASVQVGTSVPLNVLIQNDVTANPQVKWTASCGSTACGSFSASTTTSTGNTSYTAPAAIPAGNTVTVTATSLTDSTKSVSATFLITPPAPTLGDGTYVFQISSPGMSEDIFVTGVIRAHAGLILGGEQDAIAYDQNGYPYSNFEQITGGSYATTASGNLQVNIQVGQYTAETMYGTLASGGKGFIDVLNGVAGSGSLDLQTSSAAPTGGYAISLFGDNPYNSPAWIGGVINIGGEGKISGIGSELDVINSGYGINGTQTLSASTVSAPDAFGRVAIQLNPSPTSQMPVLNLAGYMVDSTHMRISQVGIPDNSYYLYLSVTGGTALGQGAATGKYSATGLVGSSYVVGAQGSDLYGSLQLAGVIRFKAGNSISGTLNWNDLAGRNPQSPLAVTGTYTVEPTGRVTLSNLTDGATFQYSLHLYLAAGGGLVLSSDSNDVFAGETFQQQSSAFSESSLLGTYGLNASGYNRTSTGASQWGDTAGSVTAAVANGADALTGFAATGSTTVDFAISGEFTPSAGGVFTGTLAGFDPTSRATPADFTLYMVDNTQGVLIETDNAQLTLGRLGLVQ